MDHTSHLLLRTATALGRAALRPFRPGVPCRLTRQRWRLGRALSSGGGRAVCAAAPLESVATKPEEAAAQGSSGGAAVAAAAEAGGFKSSAYPFTEIEAKWQAYWEANKTFRTPDFHELDTSKPKFYALDMFPYPRRAGREGPRGWAVGCVYVWLASSAAVPSDSAAVGATERVPSSAWAPHEPVLGLGLEPGAGRARQRCPWVAKQGPDCPASLLLRRTAAARACMWATRRATPPPISSHATSACAGGRVGGRAGAAAHHAAGRLHRHQACGGGRSVQPSRAG